MTAAHHRRINGSRMMRAGRHRTRTMDDTMGLRLRHSEINRKVLMHLPLLIKGGPMITHRRQVTATEIEIIAMEITTVAGIASPITTCTPLLERLSRYRQVSRFWCV
jgi:hypothetical protein